MLDAELGAVHGPLVGFAAETGLRTNEWGWCWNAATLTKPGERSPCSAVFPTALLRRTRKRNALGEGAATARALDAYRRLPARLDTPLVFPAPQGGYLSLDNWRTREWYHGLDMAGIERRGPYHLRHTFATKALVAGISISSWPA